MAQRTALIVGAGIGGLAAGLALERAGWRVRVFERAANSRELGFALNLAPNAIAALRALGIGDQVVADGHPVTHVEVRRADGRVLRRLHIAAAIGDAPSVIALRPVLHGALLSATTPDNLVVTREAVGFEMMPTGVALHFRSGESETGDVLIGADGIGSVVRRRLHPREPPLRRSLYLGLRGVAHDAEHHLGQLSAVAYFGVGVEAALVRAGQRAVYWYIAVFADDVPPEMRRPQAIVELYAPLLDETFRSVARSTKSEDLRLDELCDRAPLSGWGHGPVTLLGDAAHPMLPQTGQGAAQALEDAVALGLALSSTDDLIGALRRYEHVRSLRTRRIVKQGRLGARFMVTRSRTIDWIRAQGVRLLPLRPAVRVFMRAHRRDPHRPLRSAG